MKFKIVRMGLIAALGCFLLIASATAEPGDIDTSFGDGSGKVITPFDDGVYAQGNCSVIDAEGRILLAGHAVNKTDGRNFAIARYSLDGLLDNKFGSGNGYMITPVGSGGNARGQAMVIDHLGRILVAGYAADSTGNIKVALVCYDRNGFPDTDFGGGDGMAITPIGDGGNARAYAVVLTPHDKIILGGYAADNSGNDHFALSCYNLDGSVDVAFGGGKGYAVIPISGEPGSHGRALAVDSKGKILLAGYTHDKLGHNHFAVMRCNGDGTLDTDFGSGEGVVVMDIDPEGHDSHCYAISIYNDDRILLGGETWNVAYESDFALARLNPDGSPDLTFGSGLGYVITPFFLNGGYDIAHALKIDATGKILLAGSAKSCPFWPGGDTEGHGICYAHFALARYNPDGSSDISFGDGNGKITIPFNEAGYEYCKSIVMDSTGNIVLAGYAMVGYSSDGKEKEHFALTRIYGDEPKSGSDSGDCFIRSLLNR